MMKRKIFHGKKSFAKARGVTYYNKKVHAACVIDCEKSKLGRLLKDKGKSTIIFVKCECRVTHKKYNRQAFKRNDDDCYKLY